MRLTLPPRDLALIGVVVLAWGSNFTAMKIALEGIPAALFVGLRFLLLLPLIAVLPRPRASWAQIIAIGLFINMGQFVFLFSAMEADISAGLAALILQAQAPLTILLSVLFFHETITSRQVAGIAIAGAGMALIGLAGGGNVTLVGLGLVLCGALCWATGNLVLKSLSGVAMLPVFIWASLIPPLPMLGLSLWTETVAPLALIAEMSPRTWLAVLYVALISTVLGYSLWGTVLARHPAAHVTPFALLIPVVGIITAAILLGETLSRAEAIGAVIVLFGLTLSAIRPKGDGNEQA